VHAFPNASEIEPTHSLDKKLEMHRPSKARALKLTCAAVELPNDAYKLSNPWNGSTYGIYKQIFEFNHSYIALAFSDFAFAFV